MEFDTFGYNETPKIYPRVSHLVFTLARKLLREMIWEPYRISDQFAPTKKIMDVVLATGKQMLDHQEVWGPIKKRGRIEFILWLPYNKLAESENQLKPFLKYYFDGMVQVFAHYAVPEAAIREVQALVEKEVIDNPDYIYVNHYAWHDEMN
jgi:hypothetical protein